MDGSRLVRYLFIVLISLTIRSIIIALFVPGVGAYRALANRGMAPK